MKHAANQQLFTYWNDLRGNRVEPERSEINPGALRGILADTFILEVNEHFTFPLRIAGTRIGALFGRELKGSSFVELWNSSSHKPLLELLSSVVDERTPAVAGATSMPEGYPALELELLLLPLRHFGKTHSRIIGCLAPRSIPRWMGLLHSEPLNMTGMRILTTHSASAPADEALEYPANSVPQFAANPGASQRVGHLTVHDGGRQDPA